DRDHRERRRRAALDGDQEPGAVRERRHPVLRREAGDGRGGRLSGVLPPDAGWPARFEAERARLEDALRPWLAAEGVEHVGSTAVPGLPAKPIIDMIAGVRSLEEARAAFPTLESLGYAWRPHRPEAHLFVREGYGVHLTEPGSDLWRERLAFRDALRRSARLRDEYAAWKREHFVGDPGRL